MGRPVRISRSDYRDKVFACWLGKNIGGTLGAPYECKKQVNDLDYFDPVPSTSAPNDDLDFQLVWLRCLEDRGIEITCGDLADYWVRYLSAYPWNEYGFCRRNLGRGLRPPVSGCFENYYVDEMGSPIRSELWACVAPGDPQLAAALAWHDAVLDHARVHDPRIAPGMTDHTGFGVAASFVGPWETILRFDVGYALKSDLDPVEGDVEAMVLGGLGRSLYEVASRRGGEPLEVALDLLLEAHGRIGAVFHRGSSAMV